MVACIAEISECQTKAFLKAAVFLLCRIPLFPEHIFIFSCSNSEANRRRVKYFLKPLSCLANCYSVRPQNFLLFGGIDYPKPNQV